jgi:hypothetical protein
MDELPAGLAAPASGGVGERSGGVATASRAAGDAMPGAADDPPEFLDVDVDQLAGPRALVTLGGLHAQPDELAHPDPGQDPRHGRDRHLEQLGDLRAAETQPAQRRARRDPLLRRAVRDQLGRRGAIQQSGF